MIHQLDHGTIMKIAYSLPELGRFEVRLPVFPNFFGACRIHELLRAPTSPSHLVGSVRAGPRVLNPQKPEAAVVFESERSRKWMEMGTM